ncbi:MAG: DoxX family protein [Pseudomonadales bacterium]|jgi:putative oxidoreductase|nr:DoxX family protein [Pseudomonadales bacterium]
MENRKYDLIAATGRVLIAALFLLSGISKLGSAEGTIGYIAAAGLPLPTLGYAVALFMEIVVPIALVLGYKTRLSAATLAVFTVVAALCFHFQLGDQNQFIHFFKNIAIAGGLLQIVALGGGSLSLDGWRNSRSR